MRFLLFFVVGLLFSGAVAQAAAPTSATPWHFDFFPWNSEIRYDRNASQQMQDRRLLNLALGAGKGPSTVIFEYSKFNEKTGNSTLSVDRIHEEYLFWWKQNALEYEQVSLFASVGAGAYAEKVVTSLAGSGSTTDKGRLEVAGGLGAGLQTLVFRYVLVSLEGRLVAGKNLDPNPQPGAVLRVGLEF